ncbi:MAG: FAD-dependent oxidoreductase [Rhodospirillales bacterium]|nr:FAD-dependent oxidoreductase [Rhodospirillales bacterium]MDH3910709.1 FAD-dependent oxidoreductase [Rhodospirillales bacterium]MDH3919289.1 FAD-dependent oxidoreductase [Rhodospirillales bacterium]
MKIAVVGGGISGLSTAWLLARKHEVSLFESANYLGGHSNTVDVLLGGRVVPVDTGFIVYNERNYPNLTQLYAALGVATVASDMSFSVSLDAGGFEYFGSAPGLFAQPANLMRPDFWRMFRDLLRFYREAPRLVARRDLDRVTLGELLAEGGYSDVFAHRHLLPMAAAIWSSTLDDILAFPAQTFVRFFENHGLFNLGERPQWRSVLGGSRRYVDALCAPFRHRVHLASPIVAVWRTPAGVFLRDAAGREQSFDQLVIATHADQALAMLGPDAAAEESRVLGAFRYQENRAVLHRDPALMPRRRRAWASWNYLAEGSAETTRRVAVSYWMNRLQRLGTTRDVFVTLNPLHEPAPNLTFGDYTYHHPQFDRAALLAQERLPSIQGLNRVWFCGSYCGYGFHEDGLQAGLAVAAALGQPAPWAADVTPMSPAWRAVTPSTPAMAAE